MITNRLCPVSAVNGSTVVCTDVDQELLSRRNDAIRGRREIESFTW